MTSRSYKSEFQTETYTLLTIPSCQSPLLTSISITALLKTFLMRRNSSSRSKAKTHSSRYYYTHLPRHHPSDYSRPEAQAPRSQSMDFGPSSYQTSPAIFINDTKNIIVLACFLHLTAGADPPLREKDCPRVSYATEKKRPFCFR